MPEVSKAVGQWIVGNVGWTVIIILFVISCLFKLTKIEIDPLGAIIGWIGKMLTKDVREDVAKLQNNTNKNFESVKSDRQKAIDDLKKDYNSQIQNLKTDIDAFEERTNVSIRDMKSSTGSNCEILKGRLDAMEKSNDLQTIRQIRAHVLDFANSCMNGRKHTQKDFDNIFDENKEYHELIKKYNIENDRYKEDYDFIVRTYKRCCDNNSFLKESDIA